jgi:hypothetical protein
MVTDIKYIKTDTEKAKHLTYRVKVPLLARYQYAVLSSDICQSISATATTATVIEMRGIYRKVIIIFDVD